MPMANLTAERKPAAQLWVMYGRKEALLHTASGCAVLDGAQQCEQAAQCWA
jgi:hypothetical protein